MNHSPVVTASVGLLIGVGLLSSGLGLPAIATEVRMAQPSPAARLAEGDRLLQEGVQQIEVDRMEAARQLFQQALAIYQADAVRAAFPQESRRGEGAALYRLGYVDRSVGRYQPALEVLEPALAIAQELGDAQLELEVVAMLAAVYIDLGQFQNAMVFVEQLRQHDLQQQGAAGAPDPGGSDAAAPPAAMPAADELCPDAAALATLESSNRLGQTYQNLGEEAYLPMIERSERYQEIVRGAGDRLNEGRNLMQMGAVHYGFGQLGRAKAALEAAIAVFESMEADLIDKNRVSFFDTYRLAYWHLQQVLIAQNEPEQALVIAEQGRTRATVKLLASRTARNRTPMPPPDRFTLADIQRVAREQNATLVEYTAVSYASLVNPVLYIWVVQPTGEVSFQQVDLTGNGLLQLTCLTRSAIGARGRTPGSVVLVPTSAAQQQAAQHQQALQQLHRLLIEPIAQHLPTNPSDRVIFIPQGELFLVPFAALIDSSGDYLIEKHTILTAPSIQVLDLTRQQRDRQRPRAALRGEEMLIVGNPVMPSLWNPDTQTAEPLPALVGAEDEAVAIAEAFGTQPLLWDRASETVVKQQMPAARVIHLATHGLLEYGDPRSSGGGDFPGAIALAPSAEDDGLLTAAELYEMDLSAELAVLSACDTGRGNITGDGVVGLSRALIQAGVPSVVVSLWKVPDVPTAELMRQFYQNLQQTPDRAQALRQAMLSTMQIYPDPLNWAAFTLIGEATGANNALLEPN